jgi:hypothetical protein
MLCRIWRKRRQIRAAEYSKVVDNHAEDVLPFVQHNMQRVSRVSRPLNESGLVRGSYVAREIDLHAASEMSVPTSTRTILE